MNNTKQLMLGLCVALTLSSATVWSAESSLGKSVDDTAITAKVKSALMTNSETKARQIDVDTKDGVVQLNGYVDTAAARDAAEKTAKMVTGVSAVQNNLHLRSGEHTMGSVVDDTAITAKVKAALVADDRTKAYQIDVKTYKGVVSLGGFVATKNEKDAAENVATNIQGVASVKNSIQVKSSS